MQRSLAYLFTALIFASALAFFHVATFAQDFYDRFWWFDIPMHMLGGFIFGLLSAWLYDVSPLASYLQKNFRRNSWILGSVAIVGISWEIYEFAFGISWPQAHYWFDTIKDVIDDLIGAGVGLLVTKYLNKK